MTLFSLLPICTYRNALVNTQRHIFVLAFVLFCFFHWWRHSIWSREDIQGGKRFCASFCASLIAGSRRAFLYGDCVCLLLEIMSEVHEVRTFAPCKALLFDMFAFFSSLENYFGFRTTNVKGKTDHSVSLQWNKRFWTFLKRRVYFLDCASRINIWVDFAGLNEAPFVFCY